MVMDDDPREFLLKIVNSISFVLIWMISCVFLGIYLGYGFFENSPTWKNIVFYFYFIGSLAFLIRYLVRKWEL